MATIQICQDIIKDINEKYHTQYELLSPVGEGSFVSVFDIKGYKKSDNDTHQYVGRFTVKPTLDESWEWISKKTEQEYKLLTRKDLNGLYAGKLEKTYKDENGEWFFSIQKKFTPVTEYLRFKLKGLTSSEKKEYIYSKIFNELSEAMAYMHSLDYEKSKGILLRDVKPDNIMYDTDTDRCILCDFNTAREFDMQDYWASSTNTTGTLSFMAPEIHLIEGGTETHPNPRQDVYSLGATLLALITRKSTKVTLPSTSPYRVREIDDETKISYLEKSGLSIEFQNILFCSIQKDPEKRYQTADELNVYTSLLYNLRDTERKYDAQKEEISKLTKDLHAEQKKYEKALKSLESIKQQKKNSDDKSKEQLAARQKTIDEMSSKYAELKKEIASKNENLQSAEAELALLRVENIKLKEEKDKISSELQSVKNGNTSPNQKKESTVDEKPKITTSAKKAKRSEHDKEIEDFLKRFDIDDWEYDKKPKKKAAENKSKESTPKKTSLQRNTAKKNLPKKSILSKIKEGDITTIASVELYLNCIWGALLFIALFFNLADMIPDKSLGFLSLRFLISFLFLLVPCLYHEFTQWTDAERPPATTFFTCLWYSFLCGSIPGRWMIIPSYLVIPQGILFLLILLYSYHILCLVQADNFKKAPATLTVSVCIFIATALLAVGAIPNSNGFRVGSTIQLGQYEQDNDFTTTEEPINWKIKSIVGDIAIVVPEHYLDYSSYDVADTENLTWENSSLRKWLNSYFLTNCFTEEELNCMYVGTIETKHSGYKLFNRQKETTEDVLYPISSSQVIGHFLFRNIQPSPHALAEYEDTEKNEYKKPAVWTRTPYDGSNMVVTVENKKIGYSKSFLGSKSKAYIYPTMCISLKEYKKIKN